MSLIHLHPGQLNPKVHYISPFFHPELAAMVPEAVAPEPEPGAAEPKPGAPPPIPRVRIAPEPRIDILRRVYSLPFNQALLLEGLCLAGGDGLCAAEVCSVTSYQRAFGIIRRLANRLMHVNLTVEHIARLNKYRLSAASRREIEGMIRDERERYPRPA